MRISAVVLTKNEEKNIVDCLESLLWCDEIIVIDDNSDDRTTEIIKNIRSAGSEQVKIFTHSLNNDFSAQRNFGLSKASGDWILFVDADERVSEALASEIFNKCLVLNNVIPAKAGIHVSSGSPIKSGMTINEYNGFYIKRRDFIWNTELKHGETGNIKLLRLARKDNGKWEGPVHEEWKIKGKIGELKNSLNHYPHQSVSEFLKGINYYTDLRARELYEKQINIHWWSIILFPLVKFKVNYFIKLGVLDGIPGLISAVLMSFHSFLVRGKLWQLWQKE